MRVTAIALVAVSRCAGLEASSGRPSTQRSRREALVSVAWFPGAAWGVADFLEDVPLATDDFVSRPVSPREEDSEAASPRRKVIDRAKNRALVGGGRSRSATESLRFGVRIARSDGTFAVRDDDAGDAPLFGDLDVSIYGDLAPANAALFLELALGDAPGYSSSLFDEINGNLLIGGRVRGLDEQEVFGERVLLYQRREVLGTRLDRDLERRAAREATQIAHDRAGLLTRRRAPTQSIGLVDFGITLAPAPELDRDWTVIGAVDADPDGLLTAVKALPTYSAEAVGDFSKKQPHRRRRLSRRARPLQSCSRRRRRHQTKLHLSRKDPAQSRSHQGRPHQTRQTLTTTAIHPVFLHHVRRLKDAGPPVDTHFLSVRRERSDPAVSDKLVSSIERSSFTPSPCRIYYAQQRVGRTALSQERPGEQTALFGGLTGGRDLRRGVSRLLAARRRLGGGASRDGDGLGVAAGREGEGVNLSGEERAAERALGVHRSEFLGLDELGAVLAALGDGGFFRGDGVGIFGRERA